MNNLFNQKILNEKAERGIDLSKNNLENRRKTLNKWINLYEKGIELEEKVDNILR